MTKWGNVIGLCALSIGGVSAAWADAGRSQAIGRLIATLMVPSKGAYAYGDFNDVRRLPGVTWPNEGPSLLDKALPEGDAMALPGRTTVDGVAAIVVASGSRAGIANFLIVDSAPFGQPDEAAAGLRAAGFTLAPARCPVAGIAYPDARRWYRIAFPGHNPAFLVVTPMKTGATAYRLNLEALAPMSERDATLLTDDCGKKPMATAAGAAPSGPPRNGTEGVAAAIDAFLRAGAGSAAIPWSTLAKSALVKWMEPKPVVLTMNYPLDGGPDRNDHWWDGGIKTPTTAIDVRASGSAAAANHFYLMQVRNIRPGADFDALRARGYTIAAVRCGKPYTEGSENYFAIGGAGLPPAILFRRISVTVGVQELNYALRLDNQLPPMARGEMPAGPAGCRG